MKQRIKEDREYRDLMKEIRLVMRKLEDKTGCSGAKPDGFKGVRRNMVFS